METKAEIDEGCKSVGHGTILVDSIVRVSILCVNFLVFCLDGQH